MIFELYTVLEDLLARRHATVIGVRLCAAFSVGALCGVTASHLLLLLLLGLSLLLLLALQLLLLLHEVGASVVVQVEVEGNALVEVIVGFGDHCVAVRLNLLDLVEMLLQGLA